MSDLAQLSLAARLRALTPARVGLGRTGVSQQTSDLLDFQRSHAQARDAVHARIDASSLAANIAAVTSGEVLQLHSAARDRTVYLQRPDLGRKLDDASRVLLGGRHTASKERAGNTLRFDLAVIVADGLSALAVERHSVALLQELARRLAGWRWAPVCVVEQGRVAIGDEIGGLFNARLSVVLIGERPGLSSPDSLGAYITWEPRVGKTDAERNCISNIRAEGLGYDQAAEQLAFYLCEARRRQLTGVELKNESRLLPGGDTP